MVDKRNERERVQRVEFGEQTVALAKIDHRSSDHVAMDITGIKPPPRFSRSKVEVGGVYDHARYILDYLRSSLEIRIS